MKILHVSLNEYDSKKELDEAFENMPSEMQENGTLLVSSKEQAESILKIEHNISNKLGARVFWWTKENLNDVETYVMYEAIID